MKTLFLVGVERPDNQANRSSIKLLSGVCVLGLVIFLLGGPPGVQAQGAGGAPKGTAGAAGIPSATPYMVVARDAHSTVWQRLTYERAPDGTIVTNSHQYVELATGLNHLVNGQWVASREDISISPDGSLAAATNGQHQIYFPADIDDGVIKLVQPDGQVVDSEPIGLAYSDGSNSVLLAVVTNSTGAILPSGNQVIYTNAFAGLDAALLYTYTKAGFQQDVVLKESPPDPVSLGLNSANTRLQMITEFISTPPPSRTVRTVPTKAGNLEDDGLRFGTMAMGRGKAFLISTNSHSVDVQKHWLVINGRQFLVEELPIVSIAKDIDSLRPYHAQLGTGTNLVVTKNLLLPPQRLTHAPSRTTFLALARPLVQGFVLDYVTLTTQTNNFTFQGDTTYYISGAVNLSGTNTFEAGTVLKYATNTSLTLQGGSTFNWLGTAYRPVIMTANDDNSVGQNINNSTGHPTNYYANPALFLSSGVVGPAISNFRISFAQQAVSVPFVGSSRSFYNGQIVNCQNGFWATYGTLFVRNVLFSGVQTDFDDIGSVTVDVQNSSFGASAVGASLLASPDSPGDAVVVCTNCVFANMIPDYPYNAVSLGGLDNGFYNTTIQFGSNPLTDNSNPFRTVGAGSYYLAVGCAFTNAGTANIDPFLLASLQTKSVYPPLIISNVMSSYTGTNLTPQVQRDPCITPALGYHYDPLDYLVTSLSAFPDLVPVALTNGVAVGVFGAYGFTLNEVCKFVSVGKANRMNRIVWYPSVQEASVKLAGTSPGTSGIFNVAGATSTTVGVPKPMIIMQFTDVPMLGMRQSFFYDIAETYNLNTVSIQDCWLRGVYLNVSPYFVAYTNSTTAVTFKNNLFERCTVGLFNGYVDYYYGQNQFFVVDNPLSLVSYNNLFWQSTLGLTYMDSQSWIHPNWNLNDNLFDTTAYSVGGDGSWSNYIGAANNAYSQTTDAFAGTNDINPLNNLSYTNGPLGLWYINSASPTLLYAGSRSASSAGLFHETIQAVLAWNPSLNEYTETPDGTNIVSIGFHYVAVDANGNPLDSNQDGIPDYLEDPNGDGIVNSGETNWALAILIQPQSLTNSVGTSATFTVTAAGILPILYQWQFNGTNIAGATNSLYTVYPVQFSSVGSYSVMVANAFGSLTSSMAGLTVTQPPLVTQQPQSVTLPLGSNVTFSFQASGVPAPLYQWLFNGTSLTSATNGSYTVNNAQYTNAGNYSAMVNNAAGSVTSAIATLTVVGVSNIYVAGSSPQIQGSNAIIAGTSIALAAAPTPSGVAFPSGYPIWTITSQPAGSSLGNPSAGSSTAVISPTVPGQYVIWAACGASSNSFVLTAVGTNDLNYDGVADSLELGYGPQGWQTELGSWRFDTPDWINLEGQLPLSFTNLLLVSGWYVGAVEVDSSGGPAWLIYPEINTNTGIANVVCQQGSIRLMFRPNWNSVGTNNGSGPGTEARLIEIGGKGTTNGCWGLYLNSKGTNLYFCTQTNSAGITIPITNVIGSIRWASNVWHQIVVTYSATNSALYLDGQSIAASGLGVTNWPGSSVRTRGFSFGNGFGGTNWAQGRFDDLETFNYVLSPSNISTYFNTHPKPTQLTNFCLLAPIAVNFPLAQTLTNGQIVTAFNNGGGSGNSGWLDWSGGGGGNNDLITMLTNLDSVTNYVNPITGSNDILAVENWVFGNTGVKNSSGVNAALNAYTNSPNAPNPIVIGIVLWDGTNSIGTGNNLIYRVAGFANIALISYQLNSGAYIKFKYLGVRQCNAYYPDYPPINQIVSPVDLQLFNAPVANAAATIPITDAAYHFADGLTNIAYYGGTNANFITNLIYYQAITNANTNLFTYIWTNAPDGTNFLKTVASDEFGASTTSLVVRVIVNWPPVVSAGTNQIIIWPDHSTNVTLAGVASDLDHLLSALTTTWNVVSSNGPVSIANPALTNTTAGFGVAGTYVLQLTASDGAATVSSNCIITIQSRPSISIISPSNNTAFAVGKTIALNATAFDTDGVVTNVQFFSGTNFLGIVAGESSIYTLIWTNAPLGTNSVTAVAMDTEGLTNVSLPVNVIIYQPAAVSVSLDNPAPCSGSTVTFTASASGSTPLSYWWTKGGVALNQTNSSLILSNVSAASSGTYSVQVTNLYSSATASSNLTVIAGTSAIGPTNLAVIVGQTAGFVTTPIGLGPFSFRWSLNGVPLLNQTNSSLTILSAQLSSAGIYSVVVSGSCGSVTNSAVLTVNLPLTIFIVQPPNNAQETALASLSLLSVVQDAGTVTNVVYYMNGIAFASNAVSPYSVTLNNLSGGTNVFQAVAYDNFGQTANSQLVTNIVVKPFPTVQIFQPQTNQQFVAGANIVIGAQASDADGSITNVRFLFKTTLLGNVTNAVSNNLYYFSWSNVPTTSLTNITAIAFDNDGLSATSSVLITIQQPCTVSGVTNLILGASQILGGDTLSGTVILSNAATTGGQAVNLYSSNTNAIVPSFVFIPQGQTSNLFTITTLSVNSTNFTTVSAAYHGQTPALTSSLTLLPASAGVVSGGGSQSSGIVTTNLNILSITDLVQEILGPGIKFSNVTFTGTNNAAGIFSGANGILDVPSGVILSSGDVSNVIGPNTVSDATGGDPFYGWFESYDDPDLHNLAGVNTEDEAALEFDFVPETEIITWDYVFGSEEYNNFTIQCQNPFNDVFGFFVTNALYGKTNVALLPDGSPVSINDVNSYTNSNLFIDNTLGTNDPDGPNCNTGGSTEGYNSRYNTQMDGYTRKLTAYAHVVPGVTNHVKLAIADAVDYRYDSFVMIGAHSFRAAGATVYSRDDLNRQYTPTTLAAPQPGVGVSNLAAFNSQGIWGTVNGMRIQRAGSLQTLSGSHFDVELGAADLTYGDGNFGVLFTNADQLGSAIYSAEWNLLGDFYTNAQANLGNTNYLTLTNAVSSLCGQAWNATDTPEANWPWNKNILRVAVIQDHNIPQGSCRDFILGGIDSPLNGTWDISLQGRIVASSGLPNGWNVEPDHTAYGGFIVTAPSAAISQQGYEVRVLEPGWLAGLSDSFTVVPSGSIPSAPVLLPLIISTNLVDPPGNVSVTITLDSPAPFESAYVPVYTNGNPWAVVVIPNGQTSATTNLQVNGNAGNTLNLLASYNGYRAAAVSLVAGCQPPGQPQILSITTNQSGIVLTWNSVPGATAYNLSHSNSVTGASSIIFTGLAATNFTDADVLPPATYYYWVTAVSNWCVGPAATANIFLRYAAVAPAPAIIPYGGIFNSSVSVTLTNYAPNSIIFYATNGLTLNTSSPWFLNGGTVKLASSTTIAAFATNQNYTQPSPIVSANFVIVPPTPIGCGSNITASLSTVSPFSPIQGVGFYCSHFLFTNLPADIGKLVTVTASSSDFYPVMYLLDGSTNILSANEDSIFNGSESQINYSVGGAGTNVVEVTSFFPWDSGNFTLTMSCAYVPQLNVFTNAHPVFTTNSGILPIGGKIDFGVIPIGTYVTNYITVSNSGYGALVISNINVYPNASTNSWNGFSIAPMSTITLSAGGVTNLAVWLYATNLSSYDGYFIFDSNDAGNGSTPPQEPFWAEVTGDVGANPGKPFVNIYFPTNGMAIPVTNAFITNVILEIDAVVIDTNTIQSVAFQTNGALFQTDYNAPYTIFWTNPPAGGQTITAVATDSQNNTGQASVAISVGAPSLTLTPTNDCVGLSNTTFTVTATLVNATNGPIANSNVVFTVSGAHNFTYTTNTQPNGQANLTYTGTNAGPDRITATVTINGQTIQSGTIIKDWARPMSCGNSYSGTLTNTSGFSIACGCAVPSHYTDFYSFTGSSGNTVTLTMTSSNFSTFMFVETNCVNLNVPVESLDTNDTQIQFTLPAGGTYVVEATSADIFKTGNYTLTYICGAAPVPHIAALVSGTNVPDYGVLNLGVTTNNITLANTLIITNQGAATLHITGWSLYYGLTNLFTVTPSPVANLGPGGSESISVQFVSATNGQYGDALVLTNDDAYQNPFVVNLTAISYTNGAPPTVSIISPTNNAQFIVPASITISANASASGSGVTITNVVFVFKTTQGTYLIGNATTPSSGSTYTVGWVAQATGNYSLQAFAYDSQGRIGVSTNIGVSVFPSTLNQAPVTTNGYFTVLANSANNVLNVLTNASDPNGDALTITQVIPPSTPGPHGIATIVDNGQHVSYTPPPGYGSTNLNLVEDGFSCLVSDGKGGTAIAKVYIIIFATLPPSVTITNPWPTDGTLTLIAGTQTNLMVSVSNVQYVVAVQYWNGADMIGVSSNPPSFSLPWTVTTLSCDCGIQAVAIDKFGQQGVSPVAKYIIANNPNHTPYAQISYPAALPFGNLQSTSPNAAVIQDGMLVVTGSVYSVDNGTTNPAQYKVVIKSSDNTVLRDSGWLAAAEIFNGPVYTNDLTTLQNDQYIVELLARNSYQTVLKDVPFILNSSLKLGVFTFSQQDLVIPAGGVPLSVVRSYNSLNPNLGEFGYSWTYALNDLNVTFSEDREMVDPLDVDPAGPGYSGGDFSMRVGGSRNITLTLPNGQRTTFYYYEQQRGLNVYPLYYSPPGLHYTLTPVNENGTPVGPYDGFTLSWQNAGANTPHEAYDFPAFILTDTTDGTQYLIQREYEGTFDVLNGGDEPYIKAYDDNTRLASIKKASGEQIVINANTPSVSGGSQFSINYLDANGQTIRTIYFQRNPNGQISAVMDPASGAGGLPVVKYEYDANTNLAKVEKLVGRTAGTYTTNTYLYQNGQFPHYLTGILDGRGVLLARNLYDSTGKLIGVVDAEGKTNVFTYNVNGQTETTFDRMGNPTTFAYDSHGNVTTEIDALGHITQNTYDGQNNLKSTTDALTNTFYYSYDNNGNRTQTVDPLTHTNLFSYDNNGNLLTHTDPLGNSSQNQYDSHGNLTNIAQYDAQGNLVQHSSSTFVNNKLSQTFNGNGQPTASFNYDPSSNLTNSTDANGLSYSFSYDANGNQTNSSYVWVGPDGTHVMVTNLTVYDAQARVTMTIDANGNTNQTFYDSDGKVSYTIDKLGNTTSYTYDALGNVIQTVYPSGTFTRTVYDGDARPILTSDQNGISGTLSLYDAAGRVTNTIRATNVVINLEPDTANPGLYTTFIVSAGVPIATNVTAYYNNGWVKSRTTPDGQTTTYSYWPSGQTEKVTDPLGNSTFYNYDPSGHQILVWDAANHSTRFLYDATGRMISTIYNDASSVSNIFNNTGQRVGAVDQTGLETQFGYDIAGQLTNVIKPSVLDTNGNVVSPTWFYKFDQYGRLAATIDPYRRATTNFYDAQGRQVGQELPMGQTNLPTVYNVNGQLWKQYDFMGQRTEFYYDRFGRLTAKFLFTNNVTGNPYEAVCYLYNQLNQLTNVIERYGADANTNVCGGYSMFRPKGSDTGHQPVPAQLLAILNNNPRFSGGLTGLLLLALSMASIPRAKRRLLASCLVEAWRMCTVQPTQLRARISSRRLQKRRIRMPSLLWRTVSVISIFALIANQPGFDQLWTAHGQCVYPNNSSTPTTRYTYFGYDFDGHITQVNSPEGVINYGYDLATGRLTLTCTTNSEVQYTYDALGRLQTVTVVKRDGQLLNPQEVTTYGYDTVGNRSSLQLPNGILAAYQYDSLNRLTNLTYQVSGTNLSSYSYTVNSTGRRTGAVEVMLQEDNTYLTNVLTWQYDGMWRMTNEVNITTSPDGNYAFTNAYVYDQAGNRYAKSQTGGSGESVTYQYDPNDELTNQISSASGQTTYLYNSNGSLTNKTASGTVNSYTYNVANKLTGVLANGALQASYVYDDNGIRVSSTASGNTTHYLIDANNHTGYAQVLEELPSFGGAPNESYVIGDEVLAQCGPTSTTPSYFLQDGHGNNRQMVQLDSSVFKHYTYDAYGNVQTGTGSLHLSSTTAEAAPTTKLYCGEQYDSNLHMYNLRARYYDPNNGRFNQRDAFAGINPDPESLHKYLYCDSDPVNGYDPSGNFDLVSLVVTVGILATLGALVGVAVNGVNNYATGKPFFANAGKAALTGAIAGPLVYAFPFLGLILAGLGILSAGETAYQVFSNPNSSAGQKGAAILLIGLSVFGARASYNNVAQNGLWVNAGFFDSISGIEADEGLFSRTLEGISDRVSDLNDAMEGTGFKSRITMAVGVAEDSSGNRVNLVGTSEPRGYIRAPLRPLIKPDDIVVKGGGHAESDIVSYAKANNLKLIGVGATRPICNTCAQQIADAGATAATSLKNPPLTLWDLLND